MGARQSATRPVVWIPHPEGAGRLRGLPAEVTVFDGRSEPPPGIERVEFCVPGRPSPAMLAAIRRMSGLKVLQTLAAGVDGFLPALPAGVTLCNGRGIQTAAVAEWVLAAVLTMQREPGAPAARGRTRTLDGATVLIVGYGEIGAAVEARLVPFGCRVTRVARTARPGVETVAALPGLLGAADVVVSLLPRTPETGGLFDAAAFARMPDGALFVNAGRGDAADTEALTKATGSGRLRAALDVTDPEPLPGDHPLRSTPGVLLSPHVAGQTTAFLPRAYDLVRAQIERHLAGAPLANVVSKDY
ncbi:2-hydroxyacid dehydrogenase [Spongiactinospora sp. TRM90649]|uniref:2-hydroxyacid dehydrogenase n=1 Tax=Spongiactinospora sp. TRM90649 TaxID=3031114 RepID=UPI0023F6FA92|nr:2-hydroxyacid dehydrogenase [Spongiactinospora sp. TRM90649]MDF5756935.1 2-hydroxyacid dehydrogenase [Spongiactinospora sp. TRM90649]